MPTTDAAAQVTLYGISNCDSVKRARAWLAGQCVVPWPDGSISVGWDADDALQPLQRCRPAGSSRPSR